MKIIPVYLPQYHTIPENDNWWGKGFTEWENLKYAKPLFEGHCQPRVPLNRNYYDLSDVETLKWQCKLAREHGIYGFCMYHYWFNGKLLLEKPMEMLLAHPEIDINYCISWADIDWRNTWNASLNSERILIADDFDNEDLWVAHFNYLLRFFRDSRYMKIGNKPLMVIYAPQIISKHNKMMELWTAMAKDAGFDGLTYISQSAASAFDRSWDRSHFDYEVEMNPQYITYVSGNKLEERYIRLIKYSRKIKQLLHIKRSLVPDFLRGTVKKYDYDKTWRRILDHHPVSDKMIPCAFTDWDNTPRYRNNKGYLYEGVTVDKFHRYFAALVEKAKKEYSTDMMFVFAWNEWTEGGYLEPDELYGMGFLNAIKDVLEKER